MRKKSHICLSRYMLEHVDSALLESHRKAFIMGSVLPDCKPSFVTTRHNMEETFDKVCAFIDALTIDSEGEELTDSAYCRQLGEVTHYLADYFTYPHNQIYEGTIKQHCHYEKEQMMHMYQYVAGSAGRIAGADEHAVASFRSPQDLILFVREWHDVYLRGDMTVDSDCRYIVSLCCTVVEGILALLNREQAPFQYAY